MTVLEARKPFHARPLWLLVLSAASIAAIGMGLRQVMGLYVVPVSEALSLGREAFALAIALANLVWGMAAPFLGIISDKYGAGRVIVFGAVSTAVGMLLMCWAKTEMDLIWSGVALGLGVAGAGINATVGAVGRAAPPEERTAAIATVGIGAGIGLLLALPYSHLLMEALGWQTSLIVLAGTAMIILLLVWPLCGGATYEATQSSAQSAGEAFREAMRLPSFWLLNLGFFVCGFHVIFYATHLPPFVADQGLGPEIGVWGLTAVGVGNLLGTYLAGQWGRRLPKRYGLSLIYICRVFIFFGFLYLPMNGPTIIILSGLLGVLWLSTIPLTSGLIATFFGAKWLTMLYGVVFFSHQIGSFLGVWLGGAIYDRFQSYDAMWWISIALGLFAAIVHWPIVERPVARLNPQMATAGASPLRGVAEP
ncbi:Major facilitator superfamily MFS_1 [Candidatus Filomicrobium marinum]|uniref:Major facilitator superfamily MFS_1 n=2 Tax=Filomicrobium TaxID=119044 RepID=A0A0D6JA83_9HYPH|nr:MULTISPECIES: MFS transporter [Filomicrobium]MCV0368667.1 MFS transporter [Filomicrobium sp.]CFX00384.1 Major facilitator superfamily MFS_1 [Candidatus Filomicrobium marinum]CPR15219.1 Major facilitator superfamily MFS_1 [Candidatus Filomicrobium marinum]SDO68945.1 Predicted arabinose efflux permease, MFS family [Filomicrobium insigne]